MGTGAMGISPWDFNPVLAVFTPSMAKRATSVFAASPIVQGKWDGTGTPDVLSLVRGTQMHGNFYANFDANQGTAIKWWTPEKDRDPTETDDEYLWYVSASYYLRYEHDTQVLRLHIGGQEVTRAHTSVAGTLYLVIARYDCNAKIDGTNYLAISVNNAHTYGGTTQPTVAAPGATVYLGSSAGTTLPANAILEGVTWFRRVLRDSGGYGVSLNYSSTGPTNELGAIYA